MTSPTIGLTIFQPVDGGVFAPGQAVGAAGQATGKRGLEAVGIGTVILSVDGGTAVPADLTPVPKQPVPTVSWRASIQAPAVPGPHQIAVTAVADDNVTKVTHTVGIVVQGQQQPPPPPTGLTPRQSLEVSVVNPDRPSAGDWASKIVKANRSNLATSVLKLAAILNRGDQYPVCQREWVQVTAPQEDYDQDIVGFSGWLFRPELSTSDNPFTHPFGNDWECQVVLDPEFAGLLAPGNVETEDDEDKSIVEEAESLGLPRPKMTIQELGGLLGVEADSRCVPSALHPPGDVIRPRDRIAVLGRWIVDAGHRVDVKPGHTPQLPDGGTSYRSEVHPPLLMAIGGTRTLGPTDIRTRVLFTSRPFLVTQVYTTDTATINHDDGPNDGTLLNHLDHEIDKLHSDWTHLGLPDSTRIEMHPKIAAKPFRGSWSAKFTIRPPDPGELVGLTFGEAQASFQFTCRSGVRVQVIGFDEIVGGHHGHHGHREARVEVLIASSSVGYQAPRLPPRQEFVPTRDQLGDAKGLVTLEMIAGLFNPSPLVIANIEQAVLRGVVTDAYDVPGIDLLDNSHAVPFTEVTQIPSGAGIVVDHRDVQPYPIVGFLDLRWHRPDVISRGP